MVAELSAAMPVQGGYYAWVKKALGPFWGFQEGWWSWVTSFVDLALYPVLFTDYLSTLLIQQLGIHTLETNPWAHWGVCLAVIWTFTYLNIRGARSIGDSSNYFGAFILAPFLAMSVIGGVKLFICSFDAPTGRARRGAAFWEDMRKDIEEQAADVVREVATRMQVAGIPVTAVAMEGSASETVAQAISENQPDLVVIGSGRTGGLPGLLWGSVAEIVRASPVPVLVVK